MNASAEKKGLVLLFGMFAIILGVVVFLVRNINNQAESEEELIVLTLIVIDDGKGNAVSTEVFLMYEPTGKGAVFDIPGNLGAIYSSLGRVDRIDQVYKERGIETYKTEIEKLIGKKIPNSLVITMDDFSTLTDILGGLKIFVPSPVDVKDENGQRYLLPSGAVTLDGDKIRTYMMYKSEDENDDSRDVRRRNAIVQFISAINEPENEKSFLDKNNFSSYSKFFNSNSSEDSLLSLLNKFSKVDPERIIVNTTKGKFNSNLGLFIPDNNGQFLKEVMNLTLSSLRVEGNSQESRYYVLEVLNGTDIGGLAARTKTKLESAGYKVDITGNAERENNVEYENTIIIDHIGNSDAANALGSFIRCSNIQEEEVRPETEGFEAAKTDFTIIIGKDFRF
ncbi:MAG: LCP family protein [Treponema sp.]|nr:LCP family protein [Spirochaetales bacterium]MDY4901958.1 LCP family protein [Treponema sp.]